LIRFFLFCFLGMLLFCHTVASTCNRMIIAIAFAALLPPYDKKKTLKRSWQSIVNLIHGSLFSAVYVIGKEKSINSCMANVMIHSVETYSQRWGKRRIKFIDGLVFESSLNPLDLVNSYTMKAVDLSTIIRHFFF
jgi:hypothetical protein